MSTNPTLTSKPVKPVKKTLVEETVTHTGVMRTYTNPKFPNQLQFREYRSHREFMGRPVYMYSAGVNPDTGKLGCAEGIVAVGQKARGIIAVGQLANGVISVGQVATGRVLAIGQIAIAPLSLGQFGIGVAVVAQSGFGGWGIFQQGAYLFAGLGQHVTNVMTWLFG